MLDVLTAENQQLRSNGDLQLVGNFDFFLIDDTFIINNLKVLEQYDDVKIVIQNQANQYMNNLDDVDFIGM